jgi:hypothetical protein
LIKNTVRGDLPVIFLLENLECSQGVMSLYYPKILWELEGKNILAILPMHPLLTINCGWRRWRGEDTTIIL